MICEKCGAEIGQLDVALTKKLINRGADRFYCKKCLASCFRVSEDYLIEKAIEYQKQECKLFEGLILTKKEKK